MSDYPLARDVVCNRNPHSTSPSIAANQNNKIVVPIGARAANQNQVTGGFFSPGQGSGKEGVGAPTLNTSLLRGEAWQWLAPFAPRAAPVDPLEKHRKKDKREHRSRPCLLRAELPEKYAAEVRLKIRESGLRPGECIAKAVLGLHIPRQIDRASFRSVMWQLSKLGTNINQQAKVANQTGRLPEYEVLLAQSRMLKRALEELSLR